MSIEKMPGGELTEFINKLKEIKEIINLENNNLQVNASPLERQGPRKTQVVQRT